MSGCSLLSQTKVTKQEETKNWMDTQALRGGMDEYNSLKLGEAVEYTTTGGSWLTDSAGS